jgi:hypothetical protein
VNRPTTVDEQKEKSMNTATAVQPPRWYWIVSGLAVLWMLFGVLAWFMDLLTDEAGMAQMSEAQRQLYLSRPQWLFIVYAIAIFSGLVGTIGLLMRKGWASAVLGISLGAVILQFGYVFVVMDAIRLLGVAQTVAFPLVIFAIGVALLWLSLHAKKRGWIAA